MAENDENDLEEGKEEEAKKKGFPMKIILLCVVFLFVAGGGFFVWKSGFLGKFSEESKKLVEEKTGDADTKVDIDIGPIYSLEDFIVNLADAGGKRYLKIRLDLELNGENVKEEIGRRLPQMKDGVLTLLSSKRYEDIYETEGKSQLRAELLSELNQHVATGRITNIYFTEFIVQ